MTCVHRHIRVFSIDECRQDFDTEYKGDKGWMGPTRPFGEHYILSAKCTDCDKELSSLETKELTGYSVYEYRATKKMDKIKDIHEAIRVLKSAVAQIEYVRDSENTNHLEIDISTSRSVNQQVSTIIHEVAHEYLHKVIKRPSSRIRETEAEGVAFVVLSHLGLPTKAPIYIAIHGGTGKTIIDCAENIAKVSHTIISYLIEKTGGHELN